MASYRVVLRGVETGRDPELALRDLAVLSRTGIDALRPHLRSGHLVVKRNVDRETAVRYQAAIRQTGWHCAVEQDMAAKAYAAAAAALPLPPAPTQTQAPAPRKLITIVAITAVAAAIALGAAWHFNGSTIGPGVEIAGKWNCVPAGQSTERRNYIVVFGSDGSFTMTSAMSYETQFIGTYRRSNTQLRVTLQGGATMREIAASNAKVDLRGRAVKRSGDTPAGAPTIADVELNGLVVGGSSDRLNFELALPFQLNKTWSCSRL